MRILGVPILESNGEVVARLKNQLVWSQFQVQKLEELLTKIKNAEPRNFKEAVERTRVAENEKDLALETITAQAAEITELKRRLAAAGLPTEVAEA